MKKISLKKLGEVLNSNLVYTFNYSVELRSAKDGYQITPIDGTQIICTCLLADLFRLRDEYANISSIYCTERDGIPCCMVCIE